MREIILAVSYWLHLTATVVWIGGIAFILFIAIPSAKQVLGAGAGKLMGVNLKEIYSHSELQHRFYNCHRGGINRI